MTESSLNRFIQAQESTYQTALDELRHGKKTSHWIWYIFPQISGLGHSKTAQFYAIKDLTEARQYLAHPVLGPRLRTCTQAVLTHTNLSALEILGCPDNLKLQSCMTLFDVVNRHSEFEQILQQFYDGKKDQASLNKLKSTSNENPD